MGFAQVMQVIVSFAVILLAIFLAYKMAKKGNFAGQGNGMKLVSRAGISRTQNLVVAEANGKQHLIAMSDGGSVVVDSWDAPEPEIDTQSPESTVPFSEFLAKAKDKAGSVVAGTQWAGLAKQKKASEQTKAEFAENKPEGETVEEQPENFDAPVAPVEAKSDGRESFFAKANPAERGNLDVEIAKENEPVVSADSEDPETWMDRFVDDEEYAPMESGKVGSVL